MSLELGRDFWCAYRGVWVVESEFNSKESFYHEPKHGTPYVAASWGKCKCLTCSAMDEDACKSCKNPKFLKKERKDMIMKNIATHGGLRTIVSMCQQCMAQYKMHGKLR